MAVKRKNDLTFGSFCTSITRGIQLTKGQIESCLSDTPTGYRYFSLSDLNNSISSEADISELPYFDPRPLKKEVDQFCVQNNKILLSKNDTPYKVDHITNTGDEKIIVNGNIYLITVDDEKIDPIALYLWLKSKEGLMMLRNASSITSGQMKWISVSQLKRMLVPEFTPDFQTDLLLQEMKTIQENAMKVTRELDKVIEILNTVEIR